LNAGFSFSNNPMIIILAIFESKITFYLYLNKFIMQQNFSIILLNYRNYLKKIFPQTFSYIINGDLYIKTPLNNLTKLIFFLKMHSQSQFKVLADICAIDYP